MAQQAEKTDFKLADGSGYILERSHLAACRLNLQHFLWRETLGFSIHPSIPPLPQNAVVADVATGTGLWMFDVLHDHNDALIDGLDIDLRQAPHPRRLPQNIALREWDIFSDVPVDLIEKYDFVHVRLLVLVLSALDTQPVIRNLFKLLKPNGYLQWDELDCVNINVNKISSSNPTPSLDKLRTMCYSNGRHDWTLKLDDRVTQEGFINATLTKYGDNSHLTRAFTDQHMMTMEEVVLGLLRVGKQDAAHDILDVVKEAYAESLQLGATFCMPRVVCVTRKP